MGGQPQHKHFIQEAHDRRVSQVLECMETGKSALKLAKSIFENTIRSQQMCITSNNASVFCFHFNSLIFNIYEYTVNFRVLK